MKKAIKLFGLACLGVMALDAALDIARLAVEASREPDCECEGCLGCCFEDDPANDRGVVKQADAKPGVCPQCGYNFTDGDVPVDPECED